MLSQSYGRLVFLGLAAIIPLAAYLGWNSREPWGTLLLAGVPLTFLLLDALGGWRLPRARFPLMLAAFLLAAAGATVLSRYPYGSILAVVPLAAGAAGFTLARNHGRPLPRQRLMAGVLTISSALLALDALRHVPTVENLELGVGSTFIWKNALAGWLAIATPVALHLAATTRLRIFRWLAAGAAAVMAAALFFTASQAGWLAAGVGVAIVIGVPWWLTRRLPRATLRLALISGLLAIAVIGALWRLNATITTSGNPTAASLTRIASVIPESTSTRLGYWKTSLQIIADFPWFGVGPGNFASWYTHYFREPWLYTISPHGIAVLIATTFGFPAAVLFFSFIAQTLWRTARWLRRERSLGAPTDTVPWAIGWAAAVVAGLAHGLLDLSLEIPAIMVAWWLLLGCLYAATVTRDEDSAGRAPHAIGSWLRLGTAATSVAAVMLLLVADSYYQRAINDDAGTPARRIAWLRRSLVLMPLSANAHEALAQQHWEAVVRHVGKRKTNLDAMVSAAETAAAMDPGSAHRQWFLGYSYFLGQTPQHPYWPQVIEHLERAIAYDFHDPTYYRSLADAYLRLGWRRHARATITAALALYPEEEIGRITYGHVIYERLGLKEKLDGLRGLLPLTEPPSGR